MQTGIFGFSSSGKTELFRALSSEQPTARERALVKVPEPRLQPLAQLYNPARITPAEIEFLDLPGPGDAGQGLGQRVLNAIRPCECILAVLDCFSGMRDPEQQIEDIAADLIVSDLAVAEKRLERLQLDKKKGRGLDQPGEEERLQEAMTLLEQGRPLRSAPELAGAKELKGFCFLSAKPILFVWNMREDKLDSEKPPEFTGTAQGHVQVSARLERELAELESEEDRQEFLQDLGLKKSALGRIISASYQLLGLITFLTAGPKEVRAWTIPRGISALEAAGVIHSDLAKGFIRAEVLSWQDFLVCGNFKQAKEKGLLRLEGKEYQVQDGDIITFRFNV
ncbi:MAG: DUF933 domain-containing protein [Thermodesulfobacteriota bacterium]